MPAALASAGDLRQELLALEQHAAGGRLEAAGDDLDQRRLAGAVVAEQRHDLALADREADALQRFDGAEVLGDVVEHQQRFAHAAIPLPVSRSRPRSRSPVNIWPKRGDSTPDTASAAAPRSTDCWPPRATMTRGARAVAPRRDRVGQVCADAGQPFEQRRPAPARRGPSFRDRTGSRWWRWHCGRSARRSRTQSASPPLAAAAAPPATDSARGSRDCRTGRARRRARPECGRSRRHCPRRRAARRRHAPWRRRARRRNRGSNIPRSSAPRP